MKFKTTTKAIKEGCTNIKKAGYCELQALLRGHEPIAYTCGVYGWNYDVYHINGVTICTGYRGMPGERVQNATEYEQKARAIWDDYNMPYDERCARVNILVNKFCMLNTEV
jgi:hypothetical protein